MLKILAFLPFQYHLLLYSKGPFLVGHKLTITDGHMSDFTTFNYSFGGAQPIVGNNLYFLFVTHLAAL